MKSVIALHSVDPARSAFSLCAGNYFERQIGRGQQYLASITEPIEAMDHLIEWLPAHIPASARATQVRVVHGDYRLDNPRARPMRRIVAVLDWELGPRPSARRLQPPLHVVAHHARRRPRRAASAARPRRARHPERARVRTPLP
jgi:hypothetical protein